MTDETQIVTSGSVNVVLLYHELTGFSVRVHGYSTWGAVIDREEYLRSDHVQSDAYNVISEEVGQFLAALNDDIAHQLTQEA